MGGVGSGASSDAGELQIALIISVEQADSS